MKKLYLLRHAKSSWDDASLSDIARPLNKRGQRDAPRMGEALSQRLAPMIFHVSPAERAQQTFHHVQKNWKGLEEQHGVLTQALYTFNYRHLLDWVAERPVAGKALALVGHNPALTDLVNYLVGPGTLVNLPTAGWIELLLRIDHWSDTYSGEGKGELVYRLFPKDLVGSA